MNEERRTILEMVAQGKITREQGAQLLEALGEEAGEPAAALTEEEYSRIYSQAYGQEYEQEYEALTEKYAPGSEDLSREVKKLEDRAQAAAQRAIEDARAGMAPLSPETPAPPTPPAPPAPPVPGDQEDLERYIRESQENNERYCREMNEYRQEMAMVAAEYRREMEKLRDRAGQQGQQGEEPPGPAPSGGGWSAWLSGIGEEIRQGLREIGRDLGRDLDSAMDDVSDAVDELKESLQEVVEDWQEELMEEQEEQAEAMEEAMEEADGEENCFPGFPGGDCGQRIDPRSGGPEFENGEFVYRSWAALNTLDRLEVSWITGAVRIAPWDGDHIEVAEYSKKALDPDQRCMLFVKDSCRLSIWEYPKKQGPGGGFGKGWNLFGLPAKRLEVLIPREQCGNIGKLRVQCTSSTLDAGGLSGEDFEISGVSGTVRLRDISAESLDAGTVSGTLTLEGCSAERLSARSVSGTNTCRGFSAEKAELSTVSGSLRAHGNAEKFKVSTVSGSASLGVDQCPEKSSMHSVSGSLKLMLPEGAGFTADFSSMSGNFSSDFPARITTSGKRNRNGRAVMGSGAAKIEMHTTSGSMSVLRADGTGV